MTSSAFPLINATGMVRQPSANPIFNPRARGLQRQLCRDREMHPNAAIRGGKSELALWPLNQ
jgi:hypothetical protein